MNPNQAQRYLESGGDHCPHCRQKRIERELSIAPNGGQLEAKCFCALGCKSVWTDHYALVGVDEFTVAEGCTKKEGGE